MRFGGLILHRHAGLAGVLGVPVALILAVGGSLGIALGFARYLLAGEAASEVKGEVLLSKLGHVTVAIAKDGVGAVAFQS